MRPSEPSRPLMHARLRRGLMSGRLRPARMLRRLRRSTLRTRVLAGVVVVILIALAAFDIVAVTALRTYLISQTDAQLQSVVRQYRRDFTSFPRRPLTAAVRGAHVRQRLAPKYLGQLPPFLDQYYVRLSFGPGRGPQAAVGGNPDLVPQLSAGSLIGFAASQQVQTVTSQNGHVQLRLLAEDDRRGILYVTTSLAGVDNTVSRVELILIIGSAAAGLLAAAGTAWLVRRGLRPVETMAGQADAITAGDLTGRVSPHDPRTEVGRLGAALNGMLARIEGFIAEREASQQVTSRFFADASHELRTPLASLRANAELYQQGALPERAQVDEAMRRITAEAQRMGLLVDDMLRLARLDQHPETEHHPVDLAALASECVQRARTAHPAYSWRARLAEGLVTTGDEEQLRRAIDNLLANVAAHTPPGTTATLSATRHGSTLAVEVTDDGPGVPADRLPHIFDRFYRAPSPAHRPGAGLGLAIVTAIATTHHGTAEATPNSPHGLRVTLTLPACGAADSRPSE